MDRTSAYKKMRDLRRCEFLRKHLSLGDESVKSFDYLMNLHAMVGYYGRNEGYKSHINLFGKIMDNFDNLDIFINEIPMTGFYRNACAILILLCTFFSLLLRFYLLVTEPYINLYNYMTR